MTVQGDPRGVKRAPGDSGSLELSSGRENMHFFSKTDEQGIWDTKQIWYVGWLWTDSYKDGTQESRLWRRRVKVRTHLQCLLTEQIWTSAIIDESVEGTMHDLCRITSAEPCNTECKVARQERVLFHIEVIALYARHMFRERPFNLTDQPTGS